MLLPLTTNIAELQGGGGGNVFTSVQSLPKSWVACF